MHLEEIAIQLANSSVSLAFYLSGLATVDDGNVYGLIIYVL